MEVSMDALGKDQRAIRHTVEDHAGERYEHYLAEQDADEPEIIKSPHDTDAVTPLANNQDVADDNDDDDVAELNGRQLSFSSLTSEHTKYDIRTGVRGSPTRHAVYHTPPVEGYFTAYQPRSSPSTRRGFGAPASFFQPSTGFGYTSSGHESFDSMQLPIRRAISTKSNPGHSRIRSTSQPKVSSRSQPGSKRPSNGDQLVYPDQSFAALQAPTTSTRPFPVLRTRSSHPAQNLLYNDTLRINKQDVTSGARTADNTPMSSPGLFMPSSIRSINFNDNHSTGPQLHHLQAPKETHTAEIEHDVYSGNKFINNYEVIGELGRGEHGKVKLGRDIERNSHVVAIKIVPRYSTKRRLGKLGAPEDVTKREVAILKKARHPNVVSLLEVIDDPNKNKVYLILEFVDKGEIKWRKHGVKEILAINNQRFEQEKLGADLTIEPIERELHIVHIAKARHDRLELMKRQHLGYPNAPNWSLEYAGETDDESDTFDLSRSVSRQFSHVNSPVRGNSQDDFSGLANEPSLSGTLYGAYTPEAYRHRKFSVAASAVSHMSSEMNFEQDDDQRSYVPALTLGEARRAFQDTLLGLEFLHFIGIIHRDIKPANLLVSSTGTVKISDFGVSYLGRPVTEEEVDKLHESEATALENEKDLARSVGTPAFWAPELCYETTEMFGDKKEPKITGALDLWALGITLYCMIYARLPFYHNETMGLHEAVCTAEVFCPKMRLVPVDTTSPEYVSRPIHAINSSKRLDYEIQFEYVPETVRDLIQKLLVKDPAHRITIAEAKNHPWVTEDMSNPEGFFHNPEVSKESKKKILETSEKEMDRAVVKRNFMEKISSTAGRIVGSLLGRKDTRKRASTTASSAGSSSESLHSPASSTTSTVGKVDRIRESRRASLRGDELLHALKASRDPNDHHPLAQSQSASPDSASGSPKSFPPEYFEQKTRAASTDPSPVPDSERQGRPRGPDRAVSVLSTAESVKTIRASQQQRLPIPNLTSNMDTLSSEQSLRSRVEGLWEGTAKTFNRLASRDRRDTSGSRSQSQPVAELDGHAGPSLAVSNTYAAGAFQTPDALRPVDTTSEQPSPASTLCQVDVPRQSLFRAPASDPVSFEQAQQVNQRRQIQEALSKAEAATDQSASELSSEMCPPSPDDLFLPHRGAQVAQAEMPGGTISTAVSASTIASSIDGYGNSSVSQSISNPSIGVVSNSSSPPGDHYLSDNQKHPWVHPNTHQSEANPDIMRTAETVTSHGRPTTPTATGKPLQAQHDYYANDCDDGDDDGDSSDEEGIIMGGPKRH